MVDVSVIITAKNEEGNLKNCLESIKGQNYFQDKIELIVVDNNSADKTKELARRYTDKVYNFGPERSAQRNYGARQANGEYLLFLDADMSLSGDILSECVTRCAKNNCVALYIPEKIIGNGFWIKVRNFERSFYNATAIDCVRFIRRDKFLGIGGFDENLTGPEDWDFDRRIRQVGAVDIIGSPIYHNEDRFNFRKYLEKKYYYSRSFDRYIKKWGKNDLKIKKQFGLGYRYLGVFLEDGKWKRFLRHFILAIGVYVLRLMTGMVYLISKFNCGNTVLIITPFFSPNVGGVETHLDDLCVYLSSKEIRVFVVTYMPLVTKTKARIIEKKNNIFILRVPWFGFNLFHKLLKCPLLESIYLIPALLGISFLVILLKFKDIAVIHSQGITAGLIGFILSVIFRKRHILSIHAIYEVNAIGLKANIYRRILNRADKVLALSDASQEELSRIGVNPDKLERYYYWVNQDIFRPIPDRIKLKREYGLSDKFTVLFVGRLLAIKGIDLLLEVSEQLKDNDIRFLWVGDGPLADKIKGLCQKNPKMKFIGRVNNKELAGYYNISDILCVPSQYEEGYGRVILEAFSCGLPVVASRIGGIPEIVNENVGILCNPNAGEFRVAILKLRDNDAFRKRLGESALVYAREKFSENNAQIILKAYNEY